MKNCLLMRHGESPAGLIDKERRLSEFGVSQCAHVGSKFPELNITSVLTSDYARAIESAQTFMMDRQTPFAHIQTDQLRPSGDVQQAAQVILEQLEACTDQQTLLVVCHMPIISKLASVLLAGQGQIPRYVNTATVLHFCSEFPGLGCFDLQAKEEARIS